MPKHEEKINKMLYNVKKFNEALSTLSRAINEPDYNEYVRDATIQRFEYTYETAWKAIKAVLTYQGLELRHPREIFSEAFSSGWIENPDIWDAIIEDRTAESVYESICKNYFPAFSVLHQSMNEVIRKNVDSSGKN